jgi:hypothetical protein
MKRFLIKTKCLANVASEAAAEEKALKRAIEWAQASYRQIIESTGAW